MNIQIPCIESDNWVTVQIWAKTRNKVTTIKTFVGGNIYSDKILKTTKRK